jgi:hypothetical protein
MESGDWNSELYRTRELELVRVLLERVLYGDSNSELANA